LVAPACTQINRNINAPARSEHERQAGDRKSADARAAAAA
jgi:hypothetical protein